MEMAAQLARRRLAGSFDEAMKWTPRKMFTVLSVADRLRRADMREQLAIAALGARGDPKIIDKMLGAKRQQSDE